MGPIVGRARSLCGQVARVLCGSHLAARWVENLRGSVHKGTPGVMQAGAEALREALIEANLHRVVVRLGVVSSQTDDAERAVCRADHRDAAGVVRAAGGGARR